MWHRGQKNVGQLLHLFALFLPAIVLLCLLKGVSVQADKDYTWGGPGGSTDTDPNTANGESLN